MEKSGCGLDLVEVERVVAGHRAVQPRLEEGCPSVSELVRTLKEKDKKLELELVQTSVIVFANPSNSGVDDLATVHELHCSLPASDQYWNACNFVIFIQFFLFLVFVVVNIGMFVIL